MINFTISKDSLNQECQQDFCWGDWFQNVIKSIACISIRLVGKAGLIVVVVVASMIHVVNVVQIKVYIKVASD